MSGGLEAGTVLSQTNLYTALRPCGMGGSSNPPCSVRLKPLPPPATRPMEMLASEPRPLQDWVMGSAWGPHCGELDCRQGEETVYSPVGPVPDQVPVGSVDRSKETGVPFSFTAQKVQALGAAAATAARERASTVARMASTRDNTEQQQAPGVKLGRSKHQGC